MTQPIQAPEPLSPAPAAAPGGPRRRLALAALAASAALAGATLAAWPTALRLWLPDAQGVVLVPSEASYPFALRWLSPPGTPGFVAAVAGRLAAPPPAGLVAPLGPGAAFVSAEAASGRVRVTLRLGPGGGSSGESLAARALARTLLEADPAATEVAIAYVDAAGAPAAGVHLDAGAAWTRDDLVNGAAPGPLAGVAYWPLKQAPERLVPVRVALAPGPAPAVALASAWAAGPTAPEALALAPAAPPGLSALGPDAAGTLTLECPSGLSEGPEGRLAVRAAVATFAGVPGVRALRFVRDGLPIAAVVDGRPLAEPLALGAGE